MQNLYTHQDSNVRKTWFLMIGFFAFVVFIAWVFASIYQMPEIITIAVIFALILNFVSFWYSDKIVVKISGAKPVKREEYFDLWNIVENLSITAGLPMPKVYVIPDDAPNAFATGRNPKNSVIAVTTGLLRLLDKNELEGVIAHELSHIGNRDVLVSTVAVVLAGFIALLADFFLRISIYGGRGRDNKASGYLAILGFVLIILSPIAASMIKMAVSRKREYLADSSGALLTRYPEALASALEKIGSYSGKLKKANHATAHLYISNPFGAGKLRGAMDKMFSTHPPIEERIKILRKNA
jgi:heat shock protein HtpX